MLIWILVKPNFDQDLNKFQTWKWKTKPRSLVTPKWSSGEVFETFHVPTLNHFSFTPDFIVQCSIKPHSMHGFLACMYVDLVYQIQSLVYHIRRLCAQVSHFLDFFNSMCSFWTPVKPNFDQDFTSWRHENDNLRLDPSYSLQNEALGGLLKAIDIIKIQKLVRTHRIYSESPDTHKSQLIWCVRYRMDGRITLFLRVL